MPQQKYLSAYSNQQTSVFLYLHLFHISYTNNSNPKTKRLFNIFHLETEKDHFRC